MAANSICIVAILKDEEPFLDEWILYHRMIGVDHFFLYDDNPLFPLKLFLKNHSDYVTVIQWHGQDISLEGRMNQTKAYWHSIQNFCGLFDWVAFIDGDEFIVLREHTGIKNFISEFEDCSSVSLNWHVFGHNGYYNNPPGLITASLTRRMFQPSKNVKSITKPRTIAKIPSPHSCRLKYGKRVDANRRIFSDDLYEGKTMKAHINHYQCRSFINWMSRVSRGDVNFKKEDSPDEQLWRFSEESCFKQFVTTVALNKNEFIDTYMLKYKDYLERAISDLRHS